MNIAQLPIRPHEASASLGQVLEFCSCYSSMKVRHDLTFGGVLNWSLVRAVIDLAEHSGLVLVTVAFDAQGPGGLRLRLEGGAAEDIAFLWHGIAALPGIVLAGWQSQANAFRQV